MSNIDNCFYCQSLGGLASSPAYGKCGFCGSRSTPLYLVHYQGQKKYFCCGCAWWQFPRNEKEKKNRKQMISEMAKKPLMPTKPTPEEITRKKEYVRFLNTQIYKLTSQQKFLNKQLTKLKTQLKDYQKELKKTEKWLKEK